MVRPEQPSQKMSLFEMRPQNMVNEAAALANVLNDVIEKNKLYEEIKTKDGVKKFIKCEGWTALGAMIGVMAKEVEVKELPDGSYEATVQIIKWVDGSVKGQASAYCGVDEKMWKDRPKFARRSMAVTRATSRAFRLNFSWITAFKGYEPTPAEEINETIVHVYEKPARPEQIKDDTIYSPETKSHKEYLFKLLKANNVNDKDQMKSLSDFCNNKPFSEVEKTIEMQRE